MKLELHPYPEYKDSGLPWLGKIPKHWRCLPHRAICYERKEQGYINEQLLSVTIKKGVIPQSDLIANSSKKDSSNLDKSKYKLVEQNDIVYNKMRAWQGAIGISNFRGIVSPAYVVIKIRNGNNPHYFHYLFRTLEFIKEAEKWSYGITSDMWSLRPEHFKLIYSCVPTLEEQKIIANYLDIVSAKINSFIRNRQQLIKVLNEQKRAIINQYVTGKLDPKTGKPYPKYKPSGVDWLGDIPEHWDIRPLKRLCVINNKVLPESTNTDYQFKYLDIGSVGTGILIKKPQTMQFSNSPSRARRILSCGDTIISTVRTYLRAIYYIRDDVKDLIASTGFAVLTPNSDISPEFIGFAVQSAYFIDQITANSIGIAYPAIAETRLGSIHLPIPISTKEQLNILNIIDSKIKPLDQIIYHTQSEIDLIREYRTRLITDVVTGKLDVRQASLNIDEDLAGIKEDLNIDDESMEAEESDMIENADDE